MPYKRFKNNELILRDELAVDRTLLANERTLLAYLRSGVSLMLAGVTIMHFSIKLTWFWLIGVSLIPLGAISVIIGIFKYKKMLKSIAVLRSNNYESKDSTI